jgi:PAS domain S-box-containing protein
MFTSERVVVNSASPKTDHCTLLSSLATVVVGGLVLLGWAIHFDLFKRILPGFVAMNPLTALCFMAAGLSLYLQRQPNGKLSNVRTARGLALILIIVSITKLIDQFAGTHIGIDRSLFAGSLDDNQMAPNTAFGFLLTGICLLTLDWITPHRHWPAQVPALVLAMTSLVCLIGYAYGMAGMYQISSYIPMALHTAALFQLLSVGILLSRPGRGVFSVVLLDGPAGMVARWLIPFGIALPCLLGWIRVLGQRAGYYETELGAAFMVAVTAVMFCVAVCWIANILNCTEQQRQQGILELAHSAQEIRDLYDNAPCGYHCLDANGVITAINKTELLWLGRTKQEVLGKIKFVDLIAPEGRELFNANFAMLKETGEVKELSFELLHTDGAALPVTLNVTPVYDAAGNFVASRATLTDATERRRVENKFRTFNSELEKRVAERTAELKIANAELVEKSQENEMFVYSVSHDLRSPLVNLQGFSQELSLGCRQLREILSQDNVPDAVEEQSAQLIDEEMGRCIRFIQTSVGRLSGIIDALLRLSRAGRVDHDPELVDLNRLVSRVVDAMSSVIYDRGVKVDVDSLPATWGDPTALEQIFANLIGNAVNYLDPARPGEIKVGCLPIEYNATSSTYYVRDNGLGIPAAYHAKVFQALKRLHPKVAQGEGIGLALVKRMVERHGGSIWFESTEGAGSTFYVSLPNLPLQELETYEMTDSPLNIGPDHENKTIGYSLSGR